MISIILCTYNQEKYIAEAIESALMQVCDEPFEILVGDDCSQDTTREVIKSYYEKYPELIRLIYPEHNLGATGNTLNLVRASKGEYLAFLDGDDAWISADILQKQVNVFRKESSIGMVVASAKIWNEQKQQYTGTLGDANCESLAKMIRYDSDVAAPTISVRKNLFEKCIIDSEWYINEDYFFDTIWAYWFAYHSQIYYIPQELAKYRVLRISECHSDNPTKLREYAKRYYAIKTRFLLENHIEIDTSYNILLNEWDKVYEEAAWRTEKTIRNSKTYKLGKILIKPLKMLKKNLRYGLKNLNS